MARAIRIMARGLAAGAVATAGLVAYLAWLHLSGNFHEVLPGELYRSAQITGADIAEVRASQGVRSILNLRGAAPDEAWYREEVAASTDLGIVHADFAMSAATGLSQQKVEELIALMETLPKPILIHCRHGSDRTGLAVALYLAAIKGADEERAEGQLSLWYGHFSVPYLSNAWPMDETFERVEPWLGYMES